MIEEIKKEINNIAKLVAKNAVNFDSNDKLKFIKINDKIAKTLDKYNNQPDYKSAWENLKRQGFNRSSDIVAHEYLKDMQELEQKYNLGGE